jgi:hypothetical protein
MIYLESFIYKKLNSFKINNLLVVWVCRYQNNSLLATD